MNDLSYYTEKLGPSIQLLYKLKGIPQDEEWHAEGSVFTPTQMVLEEVEKLIVTEASGLFSSQKDALRLSAVLHEVGKVLTTKTRCIDERE